MYNVHCTLYIDLIRKENRLILNVFHSGHFEYFEVHKQGIFNQLYPKNIDPLKAQN